MKTTAAAQRAEQRRLLTARLRWQADPVARFLIDRRLGINYDELDLADSAYVFLTRARRESAPVVSDHAADVSIVYQRLGDLYYHQKGAFDSAAAAYAEQARLLRASGLSLTAREPATLLEGPSELRIGTAVAQAYANAGLAARQNGDMERPIRYFHAALRQFTTVNNGPGIVWAAGLIGNSYQAQGNVGKAAEAYETGWQAARVQGDSTERVAEFAGMVNIL